MEYDRILVGKFSPENRCYAGQGEPLTVAGPSDKPEWRLKEGDHFFVGLKSRHPSMYGWVKRLDHPVDAKEYLSINGAGITSDEEVQRTEMMLRRIASLPEGTPVACHYTEIGILQKTRKLVIHKVFFYPKQ